MVSAAVRATGCGIVTTVNTSPANRSGTQKPSDRTHRGDSFLCRELCAGRPKLSPAKSELVTKDFFGKLSERSTVVGQCRTPAPNSAIDAAHAAFDNYLMRNQQNVGFQPVQCRVLRAGAHAVSVPTQFLGQPRAVDLVGGVMKDVQPDCRAGIRASTHLRRNGDAPDIGVRSYGAAFTRNAATPLIRSPCEVARDNATTTAPVGQPGSRRPWPGSHRAW